MVPLLGIPPPETTGDYIFLYSGLGIVLLTGIILTIRAVVRRRRESWRQGQEPWWTGENLPPDPPIPPRNPDQTGSSL